MTTLQFKNGDMRDILIPKTFGPLLGTIFNEAPVAFERSARPASDIIEKEDRYEVRLALAGYKKEDITIGLEGNKLTISGEVRQTEEEKSGKYHVREIRTGSFSRGFNLPKNANADGADANFQDGILTVSIPKAEPQGKKIEIR